MVEAFTVFVNRFVLIYYPISLVYEVFMNGTYGATLGKMAIGVKILRVDGVRLGYSTAFLRWLATRLSDMAFCIGYFFIAVREDKRAMHDLIAGTKVVFKK
jgi:uncharacterized RDD family membrane protein YckC